jgi:hypothetical protein
VFASAAAAARVWKESLAEKPSELNELSELNEPKEAGAAPGAATPESTTSDSATNAAASGDVEETQMAQIEPPGGASLPSRLAVHDWTDKDAAEVTSQEAGSYLTFASGDRIEATHIALT